MEYTKPKVDKFKIYAAIGIPEFWRFNGSVLRIYILNDGQYIEVEQSPTFAQVSVKEIPRFIQESNQRGNGDNPRFSGLGERAGLRSRILFTWRL